MQERSGRSIPYEMFYIEMKKSKINWYFETQSIFKFPAVGNTRIHLLKSTVLPQTFHD